MVLGTKLIILAVLVFLSALFSGVETAVISVNRLRLKHLIEKKVKNAQLLFDLKEKSHETISTLLIGNNLVNIAASAIATATAIDYFGSNGVGISTGIMTFVILVFAEITPKTIANNRAESVALFFAKILKLLSFLFAPIRVILDLFTRALTKAFGVTQEGSTVTEEEIKSIVNIGEEEGEIKPIEKRMIHNIFRFNDIEAEGIMIPRKDSFTFEADIKVKDAMEKIIKSGYSRFPIYEKEKDKIVGIAYLKDIIREIEHKKNPTMKKISKEPFFIPESKKIDKLLKEFQSKKVHIAIVVDEYGAYTGLVTIEDLIEEIVGEIYDEQDKVIKNIKRINNKEAIVRGDTDIKEINETLKLKIKFDPYETLSAYLLEKLGRIPKTNEKYELKNFKCVIKEMNDNRITKIKITMK